MSLTAATAEYNKATQREARSVTGQQGTTGILLQYVCVPPPDISKLFFLTKKLYELNYFRKKASIAKGGK